MRQLKDDELSELFPALRELMRLILRAGIESPLAQKWEGVLAKKLEPSAVSVPHPNGVEDSRGLEIEVRVKVSENPDLRVEVIPDLPVDDSSP